MNILHAKILATALTLSLVGCSTNRSTYAVLKKETTQKTSLADMLGNSYQKEGAGNIFYASNVIYVPNGTRFSINAEAINPGWINEGINKHLTEDSLLGRGGQKISKDEAKLIRDRNLWIVYEINSEDASDALRLNSKKIVKTSLIKYDAGSFGLVPIDSSDRNAFALEANNPYQVKITIYDIKNLDLKRISTNALRESPGVTTIIDNALKTTLKTVQSFIGDAALNAFKREYGEEQAVERMALLLDAQKVFQASFAIYRNGNAPTTPATNTYALIDPVKSYKTATTGGGVELNSPPPAITSASDYYKYLSSENAASSLSNLTSFMILSVSYAKSPELATGTNATETKAVENVKAAPLL